MTKFLKPVFTIIPTIKILTNYKRPLPYEFGIIAKDKSFVIGQIVIIVNKGLKRFVIIPLRIDENGIEKSKIFRH